MFHKVFCKAVKTFVQVVLQGRYNIVTRCFAGSPQHCYKVFCKVFTTSLQGVLQGFYILFYKVLCKAFAALLQGVLQGATAVKPGRNTCTNYVEAVHEAFVQML